MWGLLPLWCLRFAFRMEYAKFLERYKMLSALTWPNYGGSPQDGCKYILEDGCDLSRNEFAYGRSKIFIRNPRTLFMIEEKRRTRKIELIIKIQALFRGWRQKVAYQNMRKAQIKISSSWKGMKARKKFKATRGGVTLITTYWRMWTERNKFLSHLHRLAMVKAQIGIAARVRGWLTRRKICKQFRRNAGPTLFRNLERWHVRVMLQRVANSLPSRDPLDSSTIAAPSRYKRLAHGVEGLNHEWRCRLYRERTAPEQQRLLRQKLFASQVFKGKKSSYPASVAQPFVGDRVGLDDPAVAGKWQKVAELVAVTRVVAAMYADKVNRANGKLAERVVVLTSEHLLVLDTKFRLKYQLALQDVMGLSCSSQADNVLAVHCPQNKQKKELSKGDHVFYLKGSVVELVSLTALEFRKLLGKDMAINVADDLTINIDSKGGTSLSFSQGTEDQVPAALLPPCPSPPWGPLRTPTHTHLFLWNRLAYRLPLLVCC